MVDRLDEQHNVYQKYEDEEYGRRVYNAFQASYRGLKVFREFREAILREYVTQHYGEQGAADRIPYNLLELAIDVFKPILMGPNIKVLAVAKDPVNAQFAEGLTLAINHVLDAIDFKSELELVIMESLLGIGVMKIGIAPSDLSPNAAYDVGQYYADCVALEDFVCDVFADKIQHCAFIGNRYWVGLEDILNNPSMPDEAKERARKRATKRDSDEKATGDGIVHSAEKLSGVRKAANESLDYQVQLWDIWIRRENVMLTYLDGDPVPIWARPWLGPRRGPYRFLMYHRVPKNTFPKCPTMSWKDNHDAVNTLLRKYIRGAIRRKSILAVAQTYMQDGERLRDAADGDAVPVADPTVHRELFLGGADSVTLGAANVLRQLGNVAAGNVELLGGLRQQSPTLGQDQILNQNASDRISYMLHTVHEFIKGVASDLAAWIWDDPFLEVVDYKRIPGTTISIPIRFGPEERRGTIEDYGFDVVPHSVRFRPPSERLAQLIRVIQEMIVPLMPVYQQEGLTISGSKIINYIARYLDLPELLDIVAPSGSTGVDSTELAYGKGLKPIAEAQVEGSKVARLDESDPVGEAISSLLSQGSE
ncbi:MAG: hypothetical protein KatS3mg087_1138 [Patescibacteria group bacterium]|nr:MAG: hypothetical protein KatS3mg087_1138 [Patescibacteria group bacterium]